MSLKAGAHQLNLTNSIGGTIAVKTEKGGSTYLQQLLLIHYFFVSRSQEKAAFWVIHRSFLYPESAIQLPTSFSIAASSSFSIAN
jgi:hypothetical protein